jgi:hypothetical protein
VTGADVVAVVTYLLDLSRDDCIDLLASASLGRLGVVVDGHPEFFPLNHV